MAEDNKKGGRNRIGQGFGKGTGGKDDKGQKPTSKQKEAGFAGKQAKETEEQTKSLKELVDTLKEQSGNVKSNVEASVDVEKSLKSLEGFMGYKSNEETLILREQFDKLKATMDEQVKLQEAGLPFNQNLLDSAQDQLEVLKEGIQSEEDKREAIAKQEEANNLLLKMSNAFDKGLGKVKETGGFLAGIAGLAALVLDPEAFAKGLIKVINFVKDMVDTVEKVFAGDFEGAAALIKDNGGIISAILGGVLLWNLGKIMRGMSLILKGFKVFRLFMMGTFIPAIGTALMSIMTAMAPILVAMTPLIIPILKIAALFGVMYFALTKIRDALGFTSIFDVIELALAYVKDGLAHFANVWIRFSKELAEAAVWIADKLGLEDYVPDFIKRAASRELSATNNAELKRAELDEKARVAKLEEERKEKGFEGEQTTGLEGIENVVEKPDISGDLEKMKAEADTKEDEEKFLGLIPKIDMSKFGLDALLEPKPLTKEEQAMDQFEVKDPTTGMEISEMSAQNALDHAMAKRNINQSNLVQNLQQRGAVSGSYNSQNIVVNHATGPATEWLVGASSGIPLGAVNNR